MGSFRKTFTEGVREVCRFIRHCHSGKTVAKCSLVVRIKQVLCLLYRLFISLLHVKDKDRNELRNENRKGVKTDTNRNIKRNTKADTNRNTVSLIVLQKEGLIDIHTISHFIRGYVKEDAYLLVCHSKQHSKYHINNLGEGLKKTVDSRKHVHLKIKGSSCSFQLIVKRISPKYLEISNIIYKWIDSRGCLDSRDSKDSRGCLDSRDSRGDRYKQSTLSIPSTHLSLSKHHTHLLHTHRDSFFYSKRFNTIDKISHHQRGDIKKSKESLIKFYSLYGDYIFRKNVSWYSQASPLEYKHIVVTDVVDSTRLWNESYEGMSVAITKHDYLVLDLVDKCGGVVSRNEGDAFYLFFRTKEKATNFSLLFKRHSQRIKVGEEHLKVKIAIHSGEVKMSDSRNLNCIGTPLLRLTEILSHSSEEKICITKGLFNKYTETYPFLFCIH